MRRISVSVWGGRHRHLVKVLFSRVCRDAQRPGWACFDMLCDTSLIPKEGAPSPSLSPMLVSPRIVQLGDSSDESET